VDARRDRYVGLLVLLASALVLVNLTSDFLYDRAIAAQVEQEDQPVVAAIAMMPNVRRRTD